MLGHYHICPPNSQGGEEVDARSDIFCLGAVLYEMVTGQRPFQGRAPATIFDQILNHAPEPAANLNDEVPALLERILDRALEKDRGNIYQTAADFLEDLRGLRTGSAAPNSEELEDSSPRKFPLSRRGLGIATAAFLLLVTLTSVWRFGLRSQSTASSIPGDPSSVETSDTVSSVAEIDRRFIAVLPFVDLNADQGNLAFTSGLHGDILTHLSRVKALKVISRTSVMEYAETTKNLRQIAEELGVGTILEGGIQQAGNRVRVNLQLIDARTDQHLWADTFDRALEALSSVGHNNAFAGGGVRLTGGTPIGLTQHVAGNSAAATVAFDAVREEIERQIATGDHNQRRFAQNHSASAVALAGLGRKQEGIESAAKAVDLYRTPDHILIPGKILAMDGEAEAAAEQVDRAIEIPGSVFSFRMVEKNPIFDGIRDHPAWKEMSPTRRRMPSVKRPTWAKVGPGRTRSATSIPASSRGSSMPGTVGCSSSNRVRPTTFSSSTYP